MEQIHIFTHIYTQIRVCKHTHTHKQMPFGQEAAAGGEEVILAAEPDAAELRFGNISGHQVLNHSFSLFTLFSPLYNSLIICFTSLSLTLSSSCPYISVSISSRVDKICFKGETTFISFVVSESRRNVSHSLFLCWQKASQSVQLLALLRKEDFSKCSFMQSLMEALPVLHEQLRVELTSGNGYQVLVLSDRDREGSHSVTKSRNCSILCQVHSELCLSWNWLLLRLNYKMENRYKMNA